MTGNSVSIELSQSGAVKRPTGKDVLDWRKTSIIHKAWENEGSAPLVRKLKKALSKGDAGPPEETVNHTLERHHNYNGRPWCLGRDHFSYLKSRGLKPDHNFLDLGCGAMRTGIWVARYLDAGHYFGIDAHLPGLEAAANYEIPLHGLEEKRPRLLNNDQFDIGHFGVEFDWVFAFAVINHLSDELLDAALSRVRKHLRPGGRLVLSPAPRKPMEWMEQKHGLKLSHSETRDCLIIDDKIDWYEFQPVSARP